MGFEIIRQRELDFLRGLAIILVLLRHQFLFQFTHNMGWIGVDLFFVLSGFLVSGLLFREYIKFGNIKPGLFLIRRGFKIYPIYYLFYIVYLIPIIAGHHLKVGSFLADLTFTQNYFLGWGYAYTPSWSLAIEEHFYFGLAFFLWLLFKKKRIDLIVGNHYSGRSSMEKIILVIMVLCLILRITSNFIFPENAVRNFTMTHLRIDSLLAGVFISYLYYFRRDYLRSFFVKYKSLLPVIAILGVAWTPFMDPLSSFFVRTIGLTFLYISFSIVLIFFLLTDNINEKLNHLFSNVLVSLVSKVGFCSYSIYIIHSFVNSAVEKVVSRFHLNNDSYFAFISSFLLSILTGMVMTYVIERYFLNLREKYYPGRMKL